MSVAIQSSLSNIAVILLMHLCIDTLILKREKLPRIYFPIGMLTIVSGAIIFLFYLPIKYGGYQFDLRLIPILFLSFKWGWRLAVPTLIITSLWRLGMGGEGSIPGVIFGMAMPTFLALVFKEIKNTELTPITLFFLTNVSWLISDLPIIPLVPDGWNVFKEISLLRFVSFNLTAFILYFFIINTEEEIRLKEKLQYYAERDPLTGLYNIRYFESKVKSYPVTSKKMYILMIDIDHFKPINDTYGHLNGDHILKDVANVITKQTSKYDSNDMVVGRYGGEEFIVFLAVDSKDDMIKAVEEMRKEIENTNFYTECMEHSIHLTVSIGVSELSGCESLHNSITEADQFLYVSKHNGRNQIFHSDSSRQESPMI